MKRLIIPFLIFIFAGVFAFAQSGVYYMNLGNDAEKKNRYSEAAGYFKQAAESFRQEGRQGDSGLMLLRTAQSLRSAGDITGSLKYYQEAVSIFEPHASDKKVMQVMSVALNGQGLAYQQNGEYNRALGCYKRAYDNFSSLDDKVNVGAVSGNLADLYNLLGRYDDALKYLDEALDCAEDSGNKEDLAVVYGNMGNTYFLMEKYDKALNYYNKSLKYSEECGNKKYIGSMLNGVGTVYDKTGRLGEARAYYEKALDVSRQAGDRENEATVLSNLSGIYSSLGMHDEALKLLGRVPAGRENKENTAKTLNNIGVEYFNKKDYPNAIKNFTQSIEIVENLRQSVGGEVKRNHLETVFTIYKWLVSSYVLSGSPYKALEAVELSRAKYLREQLGERSGRDNVKNINAVQFQKNIKSDTLYLVYANTDWDYMVRIALARNSIKAEEIRNKLFSDKVLAVCRKNVNSGYDRQRGLVVVKKQGQSQGLNKSSSDSIDFVKIVNYYRTLLTTPGPSGEEAALLNGISRDLYNLLFDGVDIQAGIKNIVISTDGILGFIPFEALIAPDGRYLVEKYNIRYSQSLTVQDFIEKRKYRNTRKPILAFGGAVYKKIPYQSEVLTKPDMVTGIRRQVESDSRNGSPLGEHYHSLGISGWENIPGTFDEVMALENITGDARIVTGSKVSESNVKTMSTRGSLTDYKVIHFATHGVVVEAIPELSALVLSQLRDQMENEDGYLRADEISGLKLEADFVNLSACETGLGKIFRGEGVVGLTQSFIVAGANGLSVSLWQVNDTSTKEFMINMYNLALSRKTSYNDAICEIKRQFISGKIGSGRYKNPYYWAPFVYYGKGYSTSM